MIPNIADCVKKRDDLMQKNLDAVEEAMQEIEENNLFLDRLIQQARQRAGYMLEEAKKANIEALQRHILQTEAHIAQRAKVAIADLATEINLYEINITTMVNEVVSTTILKLHSFNPDFEQKTNEGFFIQSVLKQKLP